MASEPSTLYAEDTWATAHAVTAMGYARACTSPCMLRLPKGTQHIAIARGNDQPRPVEDVISVDGPATLTADWHARRGARLAGILTLSIALPIGLGMATIGYATGYADTTCNTPACYQSGRDVATVGLVVTVTSLVAGLILVTRHDFATVEVTPLTLPQSPGTAGDAPGAASDVRAMAVGANGAAVRVRF